MKKMSTKKMVTLAMFTAASYLLAVTIRFPLLGHVAFIKYSPSDIPILLGGLIFGPLEAFIMILVEALLEGFTVGTTGPIGVIMNIAATSAFVVTISMIYKRKKTNKNLMISYVIGGIVTIIAMIILNILLTPIYTSASTMAVIKMLIPAIIPVNGLKIIINIVLSYGIFQSISKFMKVEKYDTN